MGVIHLQNWGETALGTPIALSASDELSQIKNPILMIGGVHGDEPEGVALAEGLLIELKQHHRISPPWILIPCLNPDGFAAGTRVNAAGVDLNRNYPSASWTPEAKAPRYWPGPNPGSELEIQHLTQLIKKVKPQLIIHFHSWNPCIVATGAGALPVAQLLAECSGYQVQETIGYDTPGSLSQYGWHDHQIPVICIEEQEGTTLESVWPRFAPAFRKIFSQQGSRR